MEVSQSLLTPRGHSREQGPPECSHLLVPAGLPPAGQGRVHDVVSHQEKGLELREAGLGTGCPPGVPSPGSRFSPARYTSPRPGRSGGSPGPAARGPPAAGTRPPPSALGCISRPARCTPAPAGARRREQPWPAAPRPGPPALPTPPHPRPGSSPAAPGPPLPTPVPPPLPLLTCFSRATASPTSGCPSPSSVRSRTICGKKAANSSRSPAARALDSPPPLMVPVHDPAAAARGLHGPADPAPAPSTPSTPRAGHAGTRSPEARARPLSAPPLDYNSQCAPRLRGGWRGRGWSSAHWAVSSCEDEPKTVQPIESRKGRDRSR